MPGAPKGANAWRSEPILGRQGGVDDVRRLTSREQFQAVLAARVVARTEHFALHRRSHDAAPSICPGGVDDSQKAPLFPEGGLWLGALVPKRWARRAVTRNLIKRQIHQLSAVHEHLFHQAAHVVRLRAAFDPRHFISAASSPMRKAIADQLCELFRQGVPRKPAQFQL